MWQVYYVGEEWGHRGLMDDVYPVYSFIAFDVMTDLIVCTFLYNLVC